MRGGKVLIESLSNIFDDFDRVVNGDIEIVCDKPTLILAISARTGSTQLCSVLESMGVFGSPEEIFNTRGVVQKNIKRDGVVTFVEYIQKLTDSSHPCFSFKTSWSDFRPVSNIYKRIFPKAEFVFLDRFDVVAQGLSLYKAIEIGHWHSSVNSGAYVNELTDCQIDVERVRSLMKVLVNEKYQWEKFFFVNRLAVQHIYYEIIKDDWAEAAKLIAEQFGFDSLVADKGDFLCLTGENDKQFIDSFKIKYGYSWISV